MSCIMHSRCIFHERLSMAVLYIIVLHCVYNVHMKFRSFLQPLQTWGTHSTDRCCIACMKVDKRVILVVARAGARFYILVACNV